MRKNAVRKIARTSYTGNMASGVGKDISTLMTSTEAVEACGGNYRVLKTPLVAQVADPNDPSKVVNLVIPDKHAVLRSDTVKNDDGTELVALTGLGVGGNNLTLVQNDQATLIMDEIKERSKGAFAHAGVTDSGASFFMLLKLEETIKVKDEVIEEYVLFTNNHVGMRQMGIAFLPMRNGVVLNAAAKTGLDSNISVRHTPNMAGRVAEATRVLATSKSYFNKMEQDFNAMADTKLSSDQVEEIMDALIPIKDNVVRAGKAQYARDKVNELYATGQYSDALKGTAWALYTALSEYSDNHKIFAAHGVKSKDEARFQSVTNGSGAAFKQAVLAKLLAVVRAGK